MANVRLDKARRKYNSGVLFMSLCGSLYVLVYDRIKQECPSLLFVTGMLHRYKNYLLIKDIVVSPRFF